MMSLSRGRPRRGRAAARARRRTREISSCTARARQHSSLHRRRRRRRRRCVQSYARKSVRGRELIKTLAHRCARKYSACACACVYRARAYAFGLDLEHPLRVYYRTPASAESFVSSVRACVYIWNYCCCCCCCCFLSLGYLLPYLFCFVLVFFLLHVDGVGQLLLLLLPTIDVQ